MMLDNPPIDIGFDAPSGRLNQLRRLFAKSSTQSIFGIVFGSSALSQYAKGDERAQEAFEEGFKKLTRRNDDPTVLVIDQSRRRLKSNLGHGWFKRGERAIVEVSEQQEATKFLGALSADGETRFFRCESDFNSEVTIHSLLLLQQEFGENLIVVPDNAPYFASKKVQNFAEDAGIDLCYLPRYSPQLNPVKECWRRLNQQLKNRLFDDIDHLDRSIQEALQAINPPSMFNYLYP